MGAFRAPKKMLKGLEIKNPTDREIDCCKHAGKKGHALKGIPEDSEVYYDDFNLEDSSASDSSEEEDEVLEIPEESKISRTLGDNTTRTVVVLVLSLLIMQSACSVETYIDTVYVHGQALQ
jgi:hypothetical protein